MSPEEAKTLRPGDMVIYSADGVKGKIRIVSPDRIEIAWRDGQMGRLKFDEVDVIERIPFSQS